MTRILYPTERRVLSIKNGIAQVRQGAMDCVSSITIDENETDPTMKTAERVRMGGMAQARYEESDLRKLWSHKEKQNYRKFLQMYSKLITTYEPLQRKEIVEKMKKRFEGATNPRAYEQKINQGMLTNPRLQVTLKDGRRIHTSVKEQKAHSEKPKALGLEGKKS